VDQPGRFYSRFIDESFHVQVTSLKGLGCDAFIEQLSLYMAGA
jgi:hypothetical protein